MASKKKFVKLTIPEADTRVLNWLDAQDSVSVSVRVLIHREVEAHGYRDALCTDETAEKVVPVTASAEVSTMPEAGVPKSAYDEAPEQFEEHAKADQAAKQASQQTSQADEFHNEDGDLDMDKILGRE